MRQSTLYAYIGKRLRELRSKKPLTQSQLADRVSLKRTSITNIEKGRQKILVHTLCDLASALGVKPGDLLPSDLVTRKPQEKVKPPSKLTRDEERWFDKIQTGGEHGN